MFNGLRLTRSINVTNIGKLSDWNEGDKADSAMPAELTAAYNRHSIAPKITLAKEVKIEKKDTYDATKFVKILRDYAITQPVPGSQYSILMKNGNPKKVPPIVSKAQQNLDAAHSSKQKGRPR
jgi:hypothetical protein